MAVDREVFRVQGHLIEDSLNIMWADAETRSPHHPLRDLNMLFGYNATLGVWGFRDNVLDSVYDTGSFPSRGYEPNGTVANLPVIPISAVLTKADGEDFFNPAIFQVDGDYPIGSIGSVTVDAVLVNVAAVTETKSAEQFAVIFAAAIVAAGFDSYSIGSKVYVRPALTTPPAPPVPLALSLLTVA